MPLDAPVTTATFPLRRFMAFSLSISSSAFGERRSVSSRVVARRDYPTPGAILHEKRERPKIGGFLRPRVRPWALGGISLCTAAAPGGGSEGLFRTRTMAGTHDFT